MADPCTLVERKIGDERRRLMKFLTVLDTINLTVNTELKKLKSL
jgi:hypothetical protein